MEGVAAEEIGRLIGGKYRVQALLGRGGMGVVVQALHLGLERRVAIKLLRSADGDSDAARRLQREAKVVAKIRSPHVLRVLDVDTEADGSPYVVMELLEGVNFAQWVKQRGPLPADEAIEYIRQACLGLEAAHGAGIVHRDIKPSNLFLARQADNSNLVKLLDFGIARPSADSFRTPGEWTTERHIAGSPPFMSPEQAVARKFHHQLLREPKHLVWQCVLKKPSSTDCSLPAGSFIRATLPDKRLSSLATQLVKFSG